MNAFIFINKDSLKSRQLASKNACFIPIVALILEWSNAILKRLQSTHQYCNITMHNYFNEQNFGTTWTSDKEIPTLSSDHIFL